MSNNELNSLLQNIYKDHVVNTTIVVVLLLSCIIGIYISFSVGIAIFTSYTTGIILAIVLLSHRKCVSKVLLNVKDFFGYREFTEGSFNDCDICGVAKCGRHLSTSKREQWKGLFVDIELDKAVDSFYTRILTSFVESWFSLLSQDENFVQSLKQNLREATCRLIIKLKQLNAPHLLTTKLLPCTFAHYEMVQKMLHDGIPMDKLAKTVILNERAIHPAVVNRQAELDYLRAVAKCLIPRLCNNENFDSKVFYSLVRELLSCWVLLPLMDVISDPNLINLLVLLATNKSTKYTKLPKPTEKVMFLEQFVRIEAPAKPGNAKFLSDQTQLYSFMQFLKKEGAVDVLRFYLDVDSLNHELLDPKVTTDPAKLSSLYQQSEKLLKTYQSMMLNDFKEPVESLIEAHEDVKQSLQGKWQTAFHKTPEYFRLMYGTREIKEHEEIKHPESQSVFRLGSKLKGAIRGAIDGAPIEATEVPTVWDAFTDDPQITSSNTNIYNSVTQKLRKERGQNLESFIVGFMQSIEPTTDIGEDVIMMNDIKTFQKKSTPPGRNFVFGDLFELKKSSNYFHTTVQSYGIQGPSQCLIYILVRILNTPVIIVRLILAFINVSRKTVDSLISKLIDKLIRHGLYEPRLTMLITSLENHLFGPKELDPSSTELFERQRQAKRRLENVYKGLGKVSDVLQSPALNKHLMYCLFDIILAEMYPELDNTAKE